MAELSYQELQAKLDELQKNASALTSASPSASPYFKVSAKGGVSLYGLGHYPVTLYYEQWMKVLDRVDQLRSFLEANKGALKMKSAKPETC